MLQRLVTVVFFLCYLSAVILTVVAIFSFDFVALIILLPIAIAVFAFGWAFRYILTAEKSVWLPGWLRRATSRSDTLKEKISSPEFRAAAARQAKAKTKTAAIMLGVLALIVASKVIGKEVYLDHKVEKSIETSLRNPILKEFYATLKNLFPQEYDRIMREITTAMRNNASAEDAFNIGVKIMRDFIARNQTHLRHASDDTVYTAAQASLRLIEKMQKNDTKLCADFAMRGASPQYQQAKKYLAETMDVSVLMLKAIHEGQNTPLYRPEVPESAFESLVKGLENEGISMSYIGQFFNGNAPWIPPQQECAFGVALYRSIINQPKPAAANLFSFILAIPDPDKAAGTTQ